jgi:interferon-induced GTP-binding protein Mx
MGDQSSGKSSVLEAISGIPFPRGSGLVTRCATQLTMKSVPEGYPWRAHVTVDWGKPQPSASGDVSTPQELSKKIEELTDILTASQSSAFSTDAIVVRVEAPGAPDLTLIDLPGIVRTHTAGQDPGVIAQVNMLINEYLKQERTIVLAVVPANQDIATIDILERARGVDPEGVRTLGVLTKPDLVGAGSEAEVLAVLHNERKPLKLGYVMVKCRSQKELDSGVTPEEARAGELKFFDNHPDWREVKRRDLLGVAQLTQSLTALLVERIQISLPFIKWELQTQLELAEKEVAPLVEDFPSSQAEQRNLVMKLMSAYCSVIRQSARGFYSAPLLAESPEVRLFGLAQEAYEELKVAVVASRPGFGDPKFGEQLAKDMTSLRGRELPGFHNSQAFYNFVANSVEGWRPAVERCRAQVVYSTRAVSALLVSKLMPSYPGMGSAVTDIATRLINEFSEELSAKLDDIFVKESDPFTTNENMLELINQLRFRNFERALEQVMASLKEPSKPSEGVAAAEAAGWGKAELQAQVTQRLGGWYMQCHGVNIKSKVEDMTIMIEAYWDVSTKRIVDNVCMTMEHDFLGKFLKKLEAECFVLATDCMGVDGPATLDILFAEDPVLQDRRRSLIAKRGRLSGALATLRKMAPDCIAEQQKGAGTN